MAAVRVRPRTLAIDSTVDIRDIGRDERKKKKASTSEAEPRLGRSTSESAAAAGPSAASMASAGPGPAAQLLVQRSAAQGVQRKKENLRKQIEK